jgi:methionine synthase II (cobalamin-independent)
MKKGFFGQATGIGSLPQNEAKPALDLIFSHVPEIPHWPQLPMAGKEEGFIRQYLNPLLDRGLVVEAPGRSPYFTSGAQDWLERLTAFYTEVLNETNPEAPLHFNFPESAAAGFYAFVDRLRQDGPNEACYIKGQLTGPVSMGFQVTNEDMQPSFYHDDLRDVIVRSLTLQVRWQARTLKAFGLPVILFIDDPGVYGYGQSTFVGLSRTAIQESLRPLIAAAHEEGVAVGVHACAGVDWSLLFELPFDIVNIDVYHYFTSLVLYASQFQEYLSRGGALAWGLVPTSDEVETETTEKLLSRLDDYFVVLERKGVDAAKMREQLLFTPSCGTGTLTVSQAERVYHLLQALSNEYRK